MAGGVIFPDSAATVGRTPLVKLSRIGAGLPGFLLAKLEMRNPCGSVKDRLGVALIEDAERRGTLKTGTTIVEATGGNTGIGARVRSRHSRLPPDPHDASRDVG